MCKCLSEGRCGVSWGSGSTGCCLLLGFDFEDVNLWTGSFR